MPTLSEIHTGSQIIWNKFPDSADMIGHPHYILHHLTNCNKFGKSLHTTGPSLLSPSSSPLPYGISLNT